MTNWVPELSGGSGPLYLRLADQIENEIGGGALPPGVKLPPQRNLAFDIGVTIGTVGRAYAILRQRGLVSGEVGRGTYVLGRNNGHRSDTIDPDLAGTRSASVPSGKLVMDSTAAPNVGQAEILAETAARIAREHPTEVTSYTRKQPPNWAEAGRRWLAVGHWKPGTDAIVPTLGGHSAILAVIAAVTAPGDRIVFEHLTYSSIARSANLIGRRSITVEMDEDGMRPDDFDRVCAQQHPKLAFLVPGLQNPTLTIMPEERRRAIVEIARKHNVFLIEDAIYSALLDEQPLPLAEIAPERTFHVGSLSKTVAAGFRGGWVACPPHFAPRIQTANKMLSGGTPFLLAELSARLVLSGEADAIRSRVKKEIEVRASMTRASFEGYEFTSHKHAPFIWLKLPEPWLSGTFKNAAAREGVLIDDEDEYKCGRTDRAFHRARIGFSAPATREEVAGGFATLRSLLDNRMAGYDSYG
jgi:DNA-binding transcriptional MocR family regulator